MPYTFSFYKDEDFDEIEELVLRSYEWEYPVWGVSRQEFCRGLHPKFTGNEKAWEHTVGVYRKDGKIVACVINEGTYDCEVFFLFDSKTRAQEKVLLKEMIRFAKTHGTAIKADRKTRYVSVYAPRWNKVLIEMLNEAKFKEDNWRQQLFILPFTEEKFEVSLPEGYTFADGHSTPDFYLSNTHRFAFAYGGEDYACEHGAEAFNALRKMKHYNKDLDLCVLDAQKRPVAMGIIWCDERMPYCELEPLGVVWWERRKGIATALLHELANRVKQLYPNCQGMLGGDQSFYGRIGYEKKEEVLRYNWELEVIISWEKESFDKDYASEV